MVTVNKNGSPYVLTSVLRVGTKETGSVDNWAAGGLSIGVEADGRLREFGLYKKPSKGKADTHPDSNIRFSDFIIPDYEECVNLAITAHKFFYNVQFIGWDIALCEDGPAIIEGNDNWEISLMQASNEPLRQAWQEAIKR